VSVASKAAVRRKKLEELRARAAGLRAEIERPSEVARELIELEQAIELAEYSAENAEDVALVEYQEAFTEYAAARSALLDALPEFVGSMEKAQGARVRLDAKARAADELPPPRLTVTGDIDRELLARWRRITARGFNL
jgi:hypothetical protein